MHDVYQQSNERFIEEERPRVVQAASSTHNNPNVGLPYPYDPDENEIDKETYFTNIKGKIHLNLLSSFFIIETYTRKHDLKESISWLSETSTFPSFISF